MIRDQWEMTRAIAFNVMRFGNSNPKKAPKTIEKFWHFPWDKKPAAANYNEIFKRHALLKAKRAQFDKENAARGES